MEENVTIVLNILNRNMSVDIEVPLFISANELVIALNSAYDLGIDISDVKKCYLKAENPIAFLKGNRTLQEYGIRNGTVINFTD